jgi:glycosyltransferase involved in cell wall biosynthesis
MRKPTVETAAGHYGDRRPHALVVAYCFPPEASIGTHRTLRLVRELIARRWQVSVLTGTVATYPGSSPMDGDLLERVHPDVHVVRAPVLRPFERMSAMFGGRPSSPGADLPGSPSARTSDARNAGGLARLRRSKRRLEGLLRIPDSHVGWVVPAVAKGTSAGVRRRPDVLYSTAPPWTGQLVARMLASTLRCPWVADFRDPWARAPWREGWLPAARRSAEILERSVVMRADAVVFTTRTNMDEYAHHYGASLASKFHLVRNGCDRDEFDGLLPLAGDGRFTMLHAGSLYGGRRPTALFAALAALRDRGVIDARSFCFRQIGRVALAGFDMAEERDRLGLHGMVEILPAQQRRDILREMLSASCLLLLQPGTTVSIPGKLFEYLTAGRPVLALAEEGETSDIVRGSGRGLAILPDDQPEIERAIERLVNNQVRVAEAAPIAAFEGELRTRELTRVLESVCRAPFSPCAAPAETSPEGQAR